MSSFKNSNGVFVTKGLFYELTRPGDREHCVYTLKEDDHVVGDMTYKSLGRLFLTFDDLTEYDFAVTCLGGWKHWKKIQETSDLKEFVQQWREERDARLLARQIKNIQALAESSFPAAKWLVEKGWKEAAAKATKARPKTRAKQTAKASHKSDLERIQAH